jgi:tetratricopeptide (TPR) repeat protein
MTGLTMSALNPKGLGTGLTDAGAGSDLTLKGQRQRRLQLAHEATLLNKAGRIDELRHCLEKMIELTPNDAQSLYNLGVLIYKQDDRPKAERFLRQAIEHDPDYVDAYQALGEIHYQSRHLLSAIEIFERGLRQIPTRLQLLGSLLRASATMRSPHRVEAVARRILNIDDENKDALNHLAWALISRGGDLTEAARSLSRALERAPDSPSSLALAESLAAQRQDADAAAEHGGHLDRIVSEDWQATLFAAEIFVSLKRVHRAAEVVREYLKGHPDDPHAHRYLAVTLMQDGDFIGGHGVLKQILDVTDRPSLQMVYCLNAFRLGDLETFYRYHRTRWVREGAEQMWKLPVPEWDGKAIPGGKLIVQCEQGVGDYVMYAICFPGLAPRARDVVVKAMGRMVNLFRRSFPEMQFVYEDKLPADVALESVAATAAAADLPELVGGNIEQLPGKAGVLIADPVIKQKLRKRYEEMFPGKRLIGISWRSGNRDSAATRSLELPYWEPLFDLPHCAFISLQYGDITRDLEELQAQLGDRVYWDREVNPTGDMDPFTAQISAMDLVISVDNSTVHFAGGLGKPCWAMLPLNSDWRWQGDRTDTIWYDSVELFRPDKERGWDGLVERVALRLSELDEEPLRQAEIRYRHRALTTMMAAGRVAEAEQYGRMLLADGVHKAQAMQAIARSALAAGQATDAVGILMRAVELEENPEIQADLAQAIAKAGDPDRGLILARDLTRRFPASDDASIACGRILADLLRYDEATDFFARVLRREPDNVASRQALAGLQAAQGDFAMARKNYGRILAIDPSNTTVHTAVSELLLRLREWPEGWSEFRWRHGARPGIVPPHLADPETEKQPKVWAEGGIRKQRLFISSERNLIEQLLLAGILPEVAKESRSVTIECDSRLVPVFRASFPSIEVLPVDQAKPGSLDERDIQLISTLGNLAGRFRTSAADFPARAKPFITADPTRVAELRHEYRATAGDRKLVGLSWRHGKSAPHWPSPLDAWLPLMDRPDVAVLALHPGSSDAELAEFASRSGRDLIYDRRIDVARDFSDYAAQIQACDFVVAVEDLTAVLAGAMGKPTIKLKRSVDHWWWGADEGPCPWFPALRTVAAPDGIRAFESAVAMGLLDDLMVQKR